jgi:hypothetical protein
MSTRYTARICDPFGSLLAEVANFVDNPQGGGAALDYALNVGGVGALSLTLPATFDSSLLRLDGRIGVWRSINGRTPQLDGQTVFLIRKWAYSDTTTTVTAYSANCLLRRRIIAYLAGTSFSTKGAAAAGNQIKAFVRENLGASISAGDRIGAETQADISALLSTQADLGDGVSVAAQDAYANLYDLITRIADASTQAGTYLVADVVASSETTLELRTYATVRGVDHRASSAQPVILSPQRGSLENCVLTVDRSQEVTAAICAGSGEGTARITATSLDTTRMGESPFNRIEAFGDYTNVSDATTLQDKADALVRAGRPRTEFRADVIETDGATRGIHYDLGDLVTAEFRGQQYDCRLDVIGVTLGGGRQASNAKVRYIN